MLALLVKHGHLASDGAARKKTPSPIHSAKHSEYVKTLYMPSRQLERGSSKRSGTNPDDDDNDDGVVVVYYNVLCVAMYVL